jgi:hypothetical protein
MSINIFRQILTFEKQEKKNEQLNIITLMTTAVKDCVDRMLQTEVKYIIANNSLTT